MKFFVILIIIGFSLTQLDVAAAAVEYKVECNIVQNYFKVCKNGIILELVEELFNKNNSAPVETYLYINDSKIILIAKNAFKNLLITELALELKNTNLLLKPESFSGLRRLRSLDIISGTVTPMPYSF